MLTHLAPHHLAQGVRALAEARLAVGLWLRRLVADFQEAAGRAMHILGRLPRQRLHCIAQLDDLRGRGRVSVQSWSHRNR